MKKMIFFMALAMTLTAAQAQIRIGGKSINLDKATQAVSKVAKAVTLSDAASAVSNTANRLSDTQLNKLTQAFLSAQFSQKQESAADEYGIKKCVELGFDPYGLANGLQKLADLSGGAKQSAVQKMFSSHPDDGKRVARAKALAEKYGKAQSKKK